MARSKEERRIQAACVRWFDKWYPEQRGLFFLVDNNEDNVVQGVLATAMGRRPGVGDTIYFAPKYVVIPEFKRPKKGKQQEVQKRWQEKVERLGYIVYYIIESLEQFQELVNIANGKPADYGRETGEA